MDRMAMRARAVRPSTRSPASTSSRGIIEGSAGMGWEDRGPRRHSRAVRTVGDTAPPPSPWPVAPSPREDAEVRLSRAATRERRDPIEGC